MKEMIIVLSYDSMETLGVIRTWPELLVALSGDEIWVRGIPPDTTDMLVRKLPAIHTYLADFQGRLFIPGKPVPVQTLKRMSWEPLASFLPVELPVSALPANTEQQLTVRLAPTAIPVEPRAMITTLASWKSFADKAPLIRLQGLVFAVCGDGQTLIMGAPLPSIPGRVLTLRHNLLLPAGYDFDPVSAGQFITEQFKTIKEAFILFHPDGRWEKIPGSVFVHATRSAIRLTNID